MGRSVLTSEEPSRAEVTGQPTPRQAGPVLAAVVAGVVVVMGAAVSLVAWRAEQPTWAVLFIVVTALLALQLAGMVLVAMPRRRGRLVVHHRRGESDLVIAGSPWPRRADVLSAVVSWVGLISGVLVLAAQPSATLDALGPVLVLLAFAVGCSWAAVRYLAGLRPHDRITVSRHGFEVRGSGTTEGFTWGDVVGFGVGLNGLTVLARVLADTSVPIPALQLPSDPVLIGEALEFYRANERLRGELANGAALDRIREGTFRPHAS